jgi:hypothetical protein
MARNYKELQAKMNPADVADNKQRVREDNGAYQLRARPFHHQGAALYTRTFKLSGFVKAMKALHLAEPQISTIRISLEQTREVEIGGMAGQRIFNVPDLVAAGFEPATAE